jgi:phenylacetate-CoA ligase
MKNEESIYAMTNRTSVIALIMSALSRLHIKRIWYWKSILQEEQYSDWNALNPIIQKRASALIKALKLNRYYQSNWPTGISGNDSLETLRRFPILTRTHIQKHLHEGLITENSKSRVRIDSTSGSTGQPLKFAKDKASEDVKLATEILFGEWTGWYIGQRHAMLWGFHGAGITSRIWQWFFMNVRKFPPYYESREDAVRILTKLEAFNPILITGYSSALFSFAQYFPEIRNNLKPELNGLIASAEALYPNQKRAIEIAFGCPVFMRYGSRELDNVAMECSEHDGYHILNSRFVVEIVDDNGCPMEEGEIGRIIVTDLMNHAMPFIRYDTGDEGSITREYCKCGRKSPRILELRGRSCDYLTLPSGRKIPYLIVNVTLEGMGGKVREFQFVQKSKSLWKIRIVPGVDFNKNTPQELRSLLVSQVSDELDYEIEICESIRRTSAGKYRYLVPLQNAKQ